MVNIERCIGLHESLEVIYVVDGFVATITMRDGSLDGPSAKAATCKNAINKLDALLVGQDYGTLRKGLANNEGIEAMNRYTMRGSGSAGNVRPDPKGKWCKFADHDAVVAEAIERAAMVADAAREKCLRLGVSCTGTCFEIAEAIRAQIKKSS